MTRWRHPPSGRLKLNVDGAFQMDTGQGGIGAVIRDENGRFLAAIARPFSFVCSALHMELEAMRAGLLLVIHQGMMNVDIETDCATVGTALKGDFEDLSEVGNIIEDCKSYLRAIPSVSLQSIYREANDVAHRLAHLASSGYVDEYWLEEAPVIIQDVLYEDSCTST
ncbi:putative ribonuclease H-like domain-containing protein [Rosa chinensis]|uniref:Putative ribonuclease H-like domain-containing protein n=1 Tax=Rosa chinensis TaxID=74649 RepID=A0A2P6S796_ROSCH|nr:putative ribonuclease H-like domain-containing protein [Rosa chinensis]